MSRNSFKRLSVFASMGALFLSSIAATTVSAAPRPITYEVFIGDYCAFGRAKNSSFLKVIILDKHGHEKGREAVEADPEGYWHSCTFPGAQPILPGDQIRVTVFGTGQTRNFVVPLLTARVDRGTNVVSGKAPAGTKVEIEAFDFRWDAWGESYDSTHTVTASGTGTYAFDFDTDGIDVKGGARVVARWSNGTDTVQVGRFQIAPFVSLALGTSEFVGASGPNAHIKVTLGTTPTNRVAVGNAVGSYGDTTFGGRFATPDGEHYELIGGEYLRAGVLGASSSWRVPVIKAATDVAADKVSATCFPNGRFVALVENPRGFEYGIVFGDASSTGKLEVDVTDQVDLRKGFRVAILCYSPEGDEIVGEYSAR